MWIVEAWAGIGVVTILFLLTRRMSEKGLPKRKRRQQPAVRVFEEEPAPPAILEPTRSERMDAIRQEYDEEVAFLQELELDDDERKESLEEARAKLLRRLAEIMNA